MPMKVTYDDGTVRETAAKTRDIVEFERKYGTSFLTFGEGAPMEWMYFLAWSALHRSNVEARPFDAFLDEVDSVEVVGEAAPVPTAAGPSGDSSPDSPSISV